MCSKILISSMFIYYVSKLSLCMVMMCVGGGAGVILCISVCVYPKIWNFIITEIRAGDNLVLNIIMSCMN